MTIPHVIEWHEGAPDKLEAGMYLQWSDGQLTLVGDCDFELSYGPASKDEMANSMDAVVRWTRLIKPHELTWAASMANRQLAK